MPVPSAVTHSTIVSGPGAPADGRRRDGHRDRPPTAPVGAARHRAQVDGRSLAGRARGACAMGGIIIDGHEMQHRRGRQTKETVDEKRTRNVGMGEGKRLLFTR